MKKQTKKFPYEILLEKAPYSSELNYQMWDVDICDDPEMTWWEQKSFSEVIQAVQDIANRYKPGYGWRHYESIKDGCEIAKKELKELNAVIRHMKRVYKKEVK